MPRALAFCLSAACAFPALVGFVSAPHLTDPAPFATLGAAYVAMFAGSCILALGAVCFALAMVVGRD